MMLWTCEHRESAIVAVPVGRVDEATSEDFGSHFNTCIADAAAIASKHLVIDLSGIEYMSSRGLRALTLAKRNADVVSVTITLAAANSIMREILAISRYDKLFQVTDTVAETL